MISAITPNVHRPAIVSPPRPWALPVDGRERIVRDVTALDQRGRNDDGPEAGIVQQRLAGARRCRPSPDIVERLQEKAGGDRNNGPSDDDPDQIARRDVVDEIAAGERAGGECCRAPQPHRSVVEPVTGDTAQRIGVGQRGRRRPHHAGQRVDQEQRQRLSLQADGCKSDRRREHGHHDAGANGMSLFGKGRDLRQRGEARDRRQRVDEADPGRVDADRLQPDRKERQMRTRHREHGRVEHGEAHGESPLLRYRDGDL
ncbi:hypothetical protein ACVWW4_008116 [Bradyrhizobium sp. LB7.1]